jgi:hypothetical protein
MVGLVPSQFARFSVNVTPSCYLINTLYEVIGEPPEDGAVHLMTMLDPEKVVVGATGVLGVCADRIVTISEGAEIPCTFLDCT